MNNDSRHSKSIVQRRIWHYTQWTKPNISVLGYAIYLAINATSLWGGVFPFFPEEFRSSEVTFSFTIAQALSFLFMFLISIVGSYWRSKLIARILPPLSTFSTFVGSGLLIAALYLGDLQINLVVLAGLFLGIGSAGFALAWQRFFSSLASMYGNYLLLLGTACGTIVFLILYLVPIAVTVYLVPLVLVPLCGLCIVLSNRMIDLKQPLFEDVPFEYSKAYMQVLKDYWRSALGIGSLGFISGLIRSTLLSDVSLGSVIIVISMIGSLLASITLLVIWQKGTFAIDMRTVFLTLFPIAAIGLLVFPFLDRSLSPLLSGIIYTIFAFATLVMLLQCMQISRDRGVNPLFVFGFFGSVIYFMQDVGLTFGYSTNVHTMFGQESFYVVSLTGMFILIIALYLIRTDSGLKTDNPSVGKVEFIGSLGKNTTPMLLSEADASESEDRNDEELEFDEEGNKAKAVIDISELERELAEQGQSDAIKRRCQNLKEIYCLTNRETEIMELFAHGYSMPHIAELLVVSENTVRTHSKHLYTKLGIHKRQELIELLEN